MNNELRPYDEYKTIDLKWIESIPSHWDYKKNSGIWNERKEVNYVDEELLSVTIKKGVIKQSDLLKSTSKKDASNLDKSKYKLVLPNDIAYNKMRMWQGASGRSLYRGIVSPAYIILRPIVDINSSYFHYLIRTPQYIQECYRNSYGICDDQLSLRYENFKTMFTIIPPRTEQDQIVKYLDNKLTKINKFIKSKKKLIMVLKEQKQAIINQAVTKGLDPNVKMKPSGIDYIEMIPEGWRISRLGYIGKLQNGISEAGSFFVQGYPFIGYGDVYNNDQLPLEVEGVANSNCRQQEIYSVKRGDVFFTRTSETIGEIGISSVCFVDIEKATFSGFLIRFRPIKGVLNKNFSQYYFRNDLIRHYFTKEMNIVIRASLSQNLLRNAPVILPPMDEQEKIAQFLDNRTKLIDRAIERLIKEVEFISEYRNSLISDVVTGKVDVRHIEIYEAQANDQEDQDFEYETLGEEIMKTEGGDE